MQSPKTPNNVIQLVNEIFLLPLWQAGRQPGKASIIMMASHPASHCSVGLVAGLRGRYKLFMDWGGGVSLVISKAEEVLAYVHSY